MSLSTLELITYYIIGILEFYDLLIFSLIVWKGEHNCILTMAEVWEKEKRFVPIEFIIVYLETVLFRLKPRLVFGRRGLFYATQLKISSVMSLVHLGLLCD